MRPFFPGSRVQKRAAMAVIGGTLATLGVVGYTQRTPIEHLLTAEEGFSRIIITPSASPADAGDVSESVPGTPAYIAPLTHTFPTESSPAPARSTASTAINPVDTLLTKATDYVNNNSWENILRQYAGVHGSVIISIRDYQGRDKERACRLALGRFVETTIGSVIERTSSQYLALAEAVIKKGLPDCKNDLKLSSCKNYDAQGHVTKDARCYGVRFGL